MTSPSSSGSRWPRTHRRAGVASALLDEVLALAAAGGADRVLLEVREDNADALAFYAARGFVEVDRRRRYYRDGATAVVLRRPLGRGCGHRADLPYPDPYDFDYARARA